MASSQDNVSMALFCDFENVALGVRDANYEQFDIKPILERLLLKGSIVIKKAYCDWDRYKGFKKPMHEANFELIEIPHVRQSGKNSADIRLVVDALDLCYTKSHVNTFVIISGDSDFSPLVSKLRENNKQVIGVGVKQSTSDLLVANCDEFIFYDDLVRENQRRAAKRGGAAARDAQPASNRSPEEERRRKDDIATRRSKAIELAVETFDALVLERGDGGKMWASVLKEAIKRRKPDFNESYYGFRAFGNLLEEAQARGLLEFGRDEKSGTYVYRGSASLGDTEPVGVLEGESPLEAAAAIANGRREAREPREGREGRKRGGRKGRSRDENGAAEPEAFDAPGGLSTDDDREGGGRQSDDYRAERADGSVDDARDDDVNAAERGDADSVGHDEDVRWPDVRDESPIAPWDEVPASSAARRPPNPFDAASPAGLSDDAAADQAAAFQAPVPAGPRKPQREPARKRREAERNRGRNPKADVQGMADGTGDAARAGNGVADEGTDGADRAAGRGGVDAAARTERDAANERGATRGRNAAASSRADEPTNGTAAATDAAGGRKPAAPRDLIGNATLLPEGAPAPAPSKAVVTRVPRRRGGRTAADAQERAGEAAEAGRPEATAAAGTAETISAARPVAATAGAEGADRSTTGTERRAAKTARADRAERPAPRTKAAVGDTANAGAGAAVVPATSTPATGADDATPAAKPARKAAARRRSPRKTTSTPDAG
jgi:uncharacterized LabA/DUF88 family protein